MFFAMKRAVRAMLAAVEVRLLAATRAQQAHQQRVLMALALQVRAAQTVRHLAHLLQLGQHCLPPALLPVLQQAAQVRLLALPVLKSPSPKSSSSRTRPGRSTTRRRRAR